MSQALKLTGSFRSLQVLPRELSIHSDPAGGLRPQMIHPAAFDPVRSPPVPFLECIFPDVRKKRGVRTCPDPVPRAQALGPGPRPPGHPGTGPRDRASCPGPRAPRPGAQMGPGPGARCPKVRSPGPRPGARGIPGLGLKWPQRGSTRDSGTGSPWIPMDPQPPHTIPYIPIPPLLPPGRRAAPAYPGLGPWGHHGPSGTRPPRPPRLLLWPVPGGAGCHPSAASPRILVAKGETREGAQPRGDAWRCLGYPTRLMGDILHRPEGPGHFTASRSAINLQKN